MGVPLARFVNRIKAAVDRRDLHIGGFQDDNALPDGGKR